MRLTIKRRNIGLAAVPIFVFGVVSVPWLAIVESIYGRGFVDRAVYVNTFLSGHPLFEADDSIGLLSYFTDEYLWHLFVLTLTGGLGADIEHIFLVISVSCLSVFGIIVAKNRNPLALLLLVNPLVIDFAFSQLRLALAVSLLGIAYLMGERLRWLKGLLAFLSLFVHTASILIMFIYLATQMGQKFSRLFRHGHWVQIAFLFLVGMSVSLSIGPFRELLLSAIGDRRATYTDMSSTFTYSLYWLLLFIAVGSHAKDVVTRDHFQFSFVILSIVAVNLLHGGYSTRFLAAFFPFLVSSIAGFRGGFGVAMIFLFVIYAALQWLFWLRII